MVEARTSVDSEGDAQRAVSWLKLSLQLLAAAIGVLVVLWLVSRATPAQRAIATPVQSQPGVQNLDFGKPPTGVPLFFYSDSRQPSWLQASDWTGRVRGTVRRAPGDGVFPLYASPDGSSVVVGQTVYQTNGHKVPAWQSGQGLPVWADDSLHMCGLAASATPLGSGPGPQVIQTLAIGHEPTIVGPVGSPGALTEPEIVACSWRTNRLLLVQHAQPMGIERYWLLGLPSGTPLFDQALSGTGATQYSQLVPSADARYVAVTVAQTKPTGPSVVSGAIRDAATGTVLARLADGVVVRRFSADGQAVLAVDARSSHPSIINWHTGKVLWRLSPRDLADPRELVMDAVVNPNRVGFVLAFRRPPSGSCPNGAETCTIANATPDQELMLVGANGNQRIIAQHVALVGTGY